MLVILKNYNRVVNLNSFDGIKLCEDPYDKNKISVVAYRDMGRFYMMISGSSRGDLNFNNGYQRLCSYPACEKENAQAMYDEILSSWMDGDKSFIIVN